MFDIGDFPMIVDCAKDIDISSGIESKKFGFSANAQAFKVMSDELYKNKIRSIVRELSSNAYDSHVKAGTISIPFDVYVPNSFSPIFKIRDYGTGISEKDMYDIFGNYFCSTKNKNPLMIGGYGLGCKTPFSYTEQYMVTSYQSGIAKTYSVFFDKDGFPSIAKLSEVETSEKNGFEVSFSVYKDDFDEFSLEVANAFFFYDVKPKVYGVSIQTIDYDKEMFIKKGYAFLDVDNVSILRKVQFNASSSRIFVVSGNIVYALEKSFGVSDDLMKYIVINADISDIDLSLSRESISYSNKTMAFIKEKLEFILNEICSPLKLIKDDFEKVVYCSNNLFFSRLSKVDKSLKVDFSELEKLTSNGISFAIPNSHIQSVFSRRHNYTYLNMSKSDLELRKFIHFNGSDAVILCDLDRFSIRQAKDILSEKTGFYPSKMIFIKKEFIGLYNYSDVLKLSEFYYVAKKGSSSGGKVKEKTPFVFYGVDYYGELFKCDSRSFDDEEYILNNFYYSESKELTGFQKLALKVNGKNVVFNSKMKYLKNINEIEIAQEKFEEIYAWYALHDCNLIDYYSKDFFEKRVLGIITSKFFDFKLSEESSNLRNSIMKVNILSRLKNNYGKYYEKNAEFFDLIDEVSRNFRFLVKLVNESEFVNLKIFNNEKCFDVLSVLVDEGRKESFERVTQFFS
jgi:hypothetical protein